ncbi:MAG: UDP-N-acetylglucosamine 1-carboxyvinyltransferase, partial [Candidatus Thioglobus sp.]
MYKLVIKGGIPLSGTIKSAGSKNSSLPILFASILADSPLTLKNTPYLSDVSTTLRLLMDMGAEFVLESDGSVCVDSSKLNNLSADYELVKTMRASILSLGPMLAKYGEAKISLPGGCAIGTRPVNLHLKALEELGATIMVKNGYIYAESDNLVGATIDFDQVSVTATENIVMAATLAKGTTIINNAAQEPEITDLINCLKLMGANISGTGTSTLTIEGVETLSGATYTVCPDRIEVGTYLVAAAITGGSITIKNCDPKDLRVVLDKLTDSGANIVTEGDTISLSMDGKRPTSVNIKTSAYPNFPTDMQAQFTALNAIADSSSTITETIFENRF